jgi:hypothetical protein
LARRSATIVSSKYDFVRKRLGKTQFDQLREIKKSLGLGIALCSLERSQLEDIGECSRMTRRYLPDEFMRQDKRRFESSKTLNAFKNLLPEPQMVSMHLVALDLAEYEPPPFIFDEKAIKAIKSQIKALNLGPSWWSLEVGTAHRLHLHGIIAKFKGTLPGEHIPIEGHDGSVLTLVRPIYRFEGAARYILQPKWQPYPQEIGLLCIAKTLASSDGEKLPRKNFSSTKGLMKTLETTSRKYPC